MNVDPIDFFPGCDPYYQRRSSSCCSSFCTHLLVMILSMGICGSMLYYYENYYLTQIYVNKSRVEEPIAEIKYNTNLEEKIERLNDNFKGITKWKKQMEEIVKNKNTQQESDFEKKIQDAIETYDCDKIGMYDYASLYAGGSIISIPDTRPYPANKTISIFKLLDINLLSNPEAMLQPSNLPGNCFAFHGSTGRIRIKLGKKIEIRSITMEHSLYSDDCTSAPKDFKVYGLLAPEETNGVLLGQFSYDLHGKSHQTFFIDKALSANSFAYVELHILNNYGREFTCLYRFRVHNTAVKKCGCDNIKN